MLKTEEYADFSDSVKCCVECFGPSDMLLIGEEIKEAQKSDSEANDEDLIGELVGAGDRIAVAKAMSPYYLIDPAKTYPPILMLHGDADPIVNYESQGVRMYRRYLECGVKADMICVEGAPHEGPFWSLELHQEILRFFKENL